MIGFQNRLTLGNPDTGFTMRSCSIFLKIDYRSGKATGSFLPASNQTLKRNAP